MSSTTTYTVTGMTCSHCVSAVTGELSHLQGVTDVRIDLATGAVAVTSDAPLAVDDVRAAVDEAGYELATADA
jgi:copper chaperone